MIYIFTSIILLLIVLYKFIYKLSKLVVYPKTKSYEQSYQTEVLDRNLDDFLNSISMETYTIKSSLGYDLNSTFIRNGDSKKCMVLCHGVTTNLNYSIKYAELFYKKGFSIFMYDHRNHGLSGGDFTSMGYFEKIDLKTCVDWVYSTLGNNIKLGVFGESMGAATVLQYCAIDDRVDFCIEDCGYSSVYDLLKVRLKEQFNLTLPGILPLANILIKLKYKWSFKEASPITYIKDLELPILFIHVGCDTYVPTNMVNELYDAKALGIKDIYICEGAAHAVSLITDPTNYSRAVDNFLEKLNLP